MIAWNLQRRARALSTGTATLRNVSEELRTGCALECFLSACSAIADVDPRCWELRKGLHAVGTWQGPYN
jgi:hypothetical protein